MKNALTAEESYQVRQAQVWARFWHRFDQRLYASADAATSSASSAEIYNLVQVWSAQDTHWLWQAQAWVSDETAQLWNHALNALNNSLITLTKSRGKRMELREEVIGSKSATYSSETAQGSAHHGVPEGDSGRK